MEIGDVRKGLLDAIATARRRAAERRARADRASRAFETFLEHIAAPLARQIVNALRAEKFPFSVFTPSGSVRLMSDRNTEDFVEISLDASEETPKVVARTSRSRGRRVIETEQVVGSGDPEAISEQELFAFLMKALVPFVEK